MTISLELRHLSIPFRFAYGHAKASHQGVDLVVCVARDEAGRCGYGEAVPRRYVTGESCASIFADVSKISRPLLAAASDLATLQKGVHEQAVQWQGFFPSCAFCCVEMALTDLLSRRAEQPFYAAFGKKKRAELCYSGSIGMGGKGFLVAQLLAYRAMGLKSFKVKVGGPHDLESLKTVRKILGQEVRIFVDANGAWDRETAIQKIEAFHALGVWGIEEPLRRKVPNQTKLQHDCEGTLNELHYQNNAWLRERAPLKLIADESVISPRSLQAVIDYCAFDVVDIRLSKLGGGTLSAAAIEQATSAGMQFYIGAMVGESAILATAGSSLGAVYSDHQLIQGHSHGVLHGKKVMDGGMKLGWGGRLRVSDTAGLGVVPHSKVWDTVTLQKKDFK